MKHSGIPAFNVISHKEKGGRQRSILVQTPRVVWCKGHPKSQSFWEMKTRVEGEREKKRNSTKCRFEGDVSLCYRLWYEYRTWDRISRLNFSRPDPEAQDDIPKLYSSQLDSYRPRVSITHGPIVPPSLTCNNNQVLHTHFTSFPLWFSTFFLFLFRAHKSPLIQWLSANHVTFCRENSLVLLTTRLSRGGFEMDLR